MLYFFDKYADVTALLLTLALPLIFTIYLKRNAKKSVRAVPAYFLLFGPLGILSFIFFHLFENSYRAIVAVTQGSFAYNFRFYSLILFGSVVAHLGSLYLKACFDKSLGKWKANRSYLYKMSLILLTTAPLIPVTPIAAVPSICCVISLFALPFVRRKRVPAKEDVLKSNYVINEPSAVKASYQ